MKEEKMNLSSDGRPDSDKAWLEEDEIRSGGEPETIENRDEDGGKSKTVGGEENIRLTNGDAVFFGKTIRFPQSRPFPSVPRQGTERDKEGKEIPADDEDGEWNGPSFLSFFEETVDDVGDGMPSSHVDENPISEISVLGETSRQDTATEKENLVFRRRFESFFQTEGEETGDIFSDGDSSDDGETTEEINKEKNVKLDEDTDEEENETELSYDEMVRRDEEAAAEENLDAVIRQNDEDALFVLGEKFERGAEEIDLGAATGEEVEINPTTILEAMIFVGNRENRPLPPAKAAALMRNVTESETRESVAELNRRYAATGAPFQVVETDEGFTMVLRSELEPVRDRFFNKVKEVKLSQKAIDIIALIAYRQPISAAEIQAVRPQSGGILNLLLKRGLIAQEKRATERESVHYYRTTPRLQKLLGVENLDDLPIVEEVDYR